MCRNRKLSTIMKRNIQLLALLLVGVINGISAQGIESLRGKIYKIINANKAVVGVSVSDSLGKDTLSINGDRHFPMQSVFKFHIALAVLSEVDKGKFTLEQKIDIYKNALLPKLYSPIRDKYPEGAKLSILEILGYTVAQSDNVGCDVLLKLLGGPKKVEEYFLRHNFENISIKINEETQASGWEMQFQNWTTPNAANQVLKAFYKNTGKLLSEKTYSFIWRTMKETETGPLRIKGQLPENTVVAHKTGSSGSNKEGVTAAVNDIGIVFLPNGQHFYISVFVTNSIEDNTTNEKIIADIAKVCWDYFTGSTK
jgi:beta-lactamase class A